jgi:Domain of unknown function (DUF4340)
MNVRVTLGFLAAAVVLAVLVFGLDRFNVGPTQANIAAATSTSGAVQTPAIFQFDDSKVNAFELHQGDKTVHVEKQGDAWTVAGTGDPANRSSFNSLIVRMSTLKATRQVDNPGTDLSQYGLDKPQEYAVAQLEDGTQYELDLGIKTPVQTGIYAKRSDTADVYVIPTQISTDLERLVSDPKEPPTPTPLPPTPVPATTPTPEVTPPPAG